MKTKAKVRLVEDDDDLFVERNGKRIAKRGVGRHAKQWISLEPGFVVYGDGDLVALHSDYDSLEVAG